ncbi:acetylcholine receptor subunit beta-like [Mytilus californianus]|uniref:acetylcholine receptor subunit beta-like n=1 Tax=Mytilus californianus TaxID=6549 RepID=UPI00224862E5|nr:acetylcholine receptor subunit beta-like [Mytilus californianus]
MAVLSTLFLLFIGLPVAIGAYSFTKEAALRNELFVTNSYNKLARPETGVTITMQLNLLTLKELNIRDQYLTVVGYFVMRWDETSRLKWSTNPTYSSDIQNIFCTENEIWVPPLMIENSVDNVGVISDNTVRIRVAANGKVTWSPADMFTTSCVTDVTYYPFDTQTCDIIVTSWGYTKAEMQFQVDSYVPLGVSNYQENGEWKYIGYTVTNGVENREAVKFFQIIYSLTFKRRSEFHILNSIAPMVSISLLACFVFKLSADAGEKVGFSLTILLTSAVYLTLVSDSIPTTSLTTPYLTTYLISLLGMEIVSVILTVMILDCYHTDGSTEIPKYLRLFMEKIISRLICWKCKSGCSLKQSKNGNSVMDISELKCDKEIDCYSVDNNEELSWQNIAKMLDIFCFRLYLIAFIVITVLFILKMLI